MRPLLTPDRVDQIAQWGADEAPKEVCGLLFNDGTMLMLPNRSDDPTDSYRLEWSDARDAVESLGRPELMSMTPEQVLIWHTHPSGFVGPSQRDMRSKVVGVNYAVVALSDPPKAAMY